MPRSLWSGSISFGLVHIPVKLVAAVAPNDIHFHLLHDKDHARLVQKRVCSLDGEEVGSQHTLKGYEVSPGSYVALTPEDLRSAAPEATRTIDIEDFVSLKEIDPLYFEHTYYLAPEKRAEKPYILFNRALGESAKVGIGRIVLHTKQHIALIRSVGRALVLTTLYHADEVLTTDNLNLPQEDASEREIGLAKQLIAQLTTAFDVSRYKDDYRDKLLGLIERKGPPAEESPNQGHAAPGRVVNLMEALEASLAQRGKAAANPRPTARHRS